MDNVGRFASATAGFSPEDTLGPSRATLAMSLIAAVAVHAAVLWLDPVRSDSSAPQSELTIRYLRRNPPQSDPFRFGQVPSPKRRLSRGRFSTPSPRLDIDLGGPGSSNPPSHADPGMYGLPSGHDLTVLQTIKRGRWPATSETSELRPEKDPDRRLDLSLELLDLSDLQNGRNWAMVRQDPQDRQAIKGFVRFAQVLSVRDLGRTASTGGRIDALTDALQELTGLEASFRGLVTYDDPALMAVPILTSGGAPTETEMSYLVEYLVGGGFIYDDVVDLYAEGLEKYGGLIRGQDFWKQRLPEDHPLFGSYFDLRGDVCLMGHFLKGRLVGVTPCEGVEGAPPEDRLAVNVVVHALTQQGSITQRAMTGVR